MPLLRCALLVAALALPGATAAAQSVLVGPEWHDAEAGVRLAFEERGDTLDGRITWLREALDTAGAPARDARNPEPALRDRPVLGLPMVRGMRPDGAGRWHDGTIYDARNGKTYRAAMQLAHPDTLRIRGFVKLGFVKLGRTATWTRWTGGDAP